jgi:hypothetical protein
VGICENGTPYISHSFLASLHKSRIPQKTITLEESGNPLRHVNTVPSSESL